MRGQNFLAAAFHFNRSDNIIHWKHEMGFLVACSREIVFQVVLSLAFFIGVPARLADCRLVTMMSGWRWDWTAGMP